MEAQAKHSPRQNLTLRMSTEPAELSSGLAAEPSVSGSETDSSAFLARVQAELAALHDTLTMDYFALRESALPRVNQRQSQKV